MVLKKCAICKVFLVTNVKDVDVCAECLEIQSSEVEVVHSKLVRCSACGAVFHPDYSEIGEEPVNFQNCPECKANIRFRIISSVAFVSDPLTFKPLKN